MDLSTIQREFTPRLALASMSGDSDAEWASEREEWVGAAFLGAFNLDDGTLDAARSMVGRGRTEFLPERPFSFLEDQLQASKDFKGIIGANVRGTTPGIIHKAGRLCDQHGAILEINAHCRQPEMTGIDCGQQLLKSEARLRDYVQAGTESGAVVSVKGRFEVEGVDSVRILNRTVEWGAKVIHVDAMDSEPFVERLEVPFLIANNGVRERRHVQEYVEYGADAVSVGRANDPERLKALSKHVSSVIDGAESSTRSASSVTTSSRN